MNLLSILSKFNAKELEEENIKVEPVSGLSPNEAWELEKQKDKPKDFFSFHKEMSSQSITIEK